MARNGFKLIDAEMHVMEPVDLWERYIDPEFRARAPRRLDERRWDIRTIVEGEVMASMPGGEIRNTPTRWTVSSHCRSPTGASRRSSGTTRCAFTRCSSSRHCEVP